MTEFTETQDLGSLIDNLYESNSEVLNDSLQRLIVVCQSNQPSEILPYFQSLFEKFPLLLLDENLSVIVQTSQLIIEITNQFAKEAEPYFHHVIENLIINLADSKPVVRKMASNSLSNFLQMTKNYELVYSNLTKYGILHANPQVRQKSIMAINSFVLADSSCIQNSHAFKNTIEKVIEKANEPIDTVRSAVYNVLTQLNSHYKTAFSGLVKKLHFADQEKVKKILDAPEIVAPGPDSYENTYINTKSPMRTPDIVQDLNRTGSPRKISEAADSPNRVQKNFKMTTKKTSFAPLLAGKQNLKYGLFENKTIEDANNMQDWRIRLAATEEILKTIENLETTDSLLPTLEDFAGLLITLTNDTNFKICVNALNIIGIIIKLTNQNDLNPHIEKLVVLLLDKLGDSKVAVRQIAFQILAVAAKKMDVKELLALIYCNLKETNWHMREESLLLIQIIFNSHTEQLPDELFEETIENVIETLDDQKPKVRNTARETIVNILRHSAQSIELLGRIQPLLEKELYDYMVFRVQNPENFPRNNFTPYTDDSGLEPRDALTMTGKTESTGILEQQGRPPSNNHFRSLTTSPREPSFMNVPGLNNRQSSDPVYSNSPYKRQAPEQQYNQYQANNTGYSTASSNAYYNQQGIDPNSKQGSRAMNTSTPYEKRNYDTDLSANISNFSTPYTKASTYTSESQQRSANSNITASGYYPKVHTPYQNQKSPYEISTASSSRSTYSRNAVNTIYSLENSALSNSSMAEKAKLSKAPMNYANMLEQRIQSAQVPSDGIGNTNYGPEKRTVSATEDHGKGGFSTFQNKLSKRVPVPSNEMYLEYSMTKKLDDFPSNNFEGQGSYPSFDRPIEPKNRQGDVFSSTDSLQQELLQNENKLKINATANPYRGTRPELAQKLKRLQAQQQVIMEADETKKWKENDAMSDKGRAVEKKPPLPLHKRGVSQNPNKDLDKTTEKEALSSDENEDNSFSLRNTGNSSTLKKKATMKISSEAPSSFDVKKFEYLTKDQLEPIEGNLEASLRLMNNDLKSDDWQKNFEGSNILRRLLQFHSSVLSASATFSLHTTTQDILRLVESLRSNLSKNALITLTEMCATLKKQLDPEAEMIIAKLIKKGSDANKFISEEVKQAFISASQNCSETKIVPVLLSISNQKSAPAKINICLCVESIITKNENRVNQVRDFDKMVVLLGNYMLDSAVEVRNASKQAMSILLRFLFNQTEVDKILQRGFTEGNYNRLNTIINKELSQGNTSLMITNYQATAKTRSTSFKPKAPNSKGSLEDDDEKIEQKPILFKKESRESKEIKDSKESPIPGPKEKEKKVIKGGKESQEYENLPGIFAQADATDWKSRFDAAQSLADFGKRNSETLGRSRHQLKYFDYFTKLILDSNTKVSSFAIGAFTELVPILKSSIEANITNISNASLTSLGSVNPTIKVASETLFDALTDYIDHSALIPAWTNCLPFTNQRAKVVILNKLNEICQTLYNKKAVLVTKNIIPALSKCIEETKAEVRNSTNQVFQTLYSFMNRDLLDYVPANKSQIVFDIVSGK